MNCLYHRFLLTSNYLKNGASKNILYNKIYGRVCEKVLKKIDKNDI